MTPPMAAPPTVPSTPPLEMTAPATPPTPAPVTALFWRPLMLSHDEQPAVAATTRPMAKHLARRCVFIVYSRLLTVLDSRYLVCTPLESAIVNVRKSCISSGAARYGIMQASSLPESAASPVRQGQPAVRPYR